MNNEHLSYEGRRCDRVNAPIKAWKSVFTPVQLPPIALHLRRERHKPWNYVAHRLRLPKPESYVVPSRSWTRRSKRLLSWQNVYFPLRTRRLTEQVTSSLTFHANAKIAIKHICLWIYTSSVVSGYAPSQYNIILKLLIPRSVEVSRWQWLVSYLISCFRVDVPSRVTYGSVHTSKCLQPTMDTDCKRPTNCLGRFIR